MRTELLLENYKLDLTDEISTEFTYTVDDIADFGSKNTSFSKTISIQGTARNNKILGFIFNLGHSQFTDNAQPNVLYNFDASRAAQCRILVDSIQIFKGTFRLMEIIQEGERIEYQCSVYGELGGFMATLANKRLEDLDFSAYEEAWNATNISSSWDDINGSGINYPLIDYGQVSTDKISFSYEAFRPALYVKEYLEKIIAGSGYTFDFPLLDTALFKRLVIPANSKSLYSTTTEQARATMDAETRASTNYTTWTLTTAGDFTAGSPDTTLTYGGAGSIVTSIDVSFYAYIDDVVGGTPATIEVSLRQNGAVIASESKYISVPNQPITVQLTATGVTINPSDTFYVHMDSAVTGWDQQDGDWVFGTTTPVQVPVAYGDTFNAQDVVLKGVFQKDFFISILKMFNLYVYDDKLDDRKIFIRPYVDFYDSVALDWSYKIDRSKPMSIKPMSELNARYYAFKYKPDNDYYAENYRKRFSEGYGDRIEDTDFEFGKDVSDLEIMFAGTVLYQKETTDKIYSTIHKKSNENAKEDRMDFVPRILQAKKITGVTSWNLLQDDLTTTITSYSNYGYAGHLDDPTSPTNDINFGAPKEVFFDTSSYPTTNLFNAYYSTYMSEITDKDSRLLTCTMRLNEADVFNLDFAKLYYIDGVYFRLIKVEGYNPVEHGLCKVTLLRAIDY